VIEGRARAVGRSQRACYNAPTAKVTAGAVLSAYAPPFRCEVVGGEERERERERERKGGGGGGVVELSGKTHTGVAGPPRGHAQARRGMQVLGLRGSRPSATQRGALLRPAPGVYKARQYSPSPLPSVWPHIAASTRVMARSHGGTVASEKPWQQWTKRLWLRSQRRRTGRKRQLEQRTAIKTPTTAETKAKATTKQWNRALQLAQYSCNTTKTRRGSASSTQSVAPQRNPDP
jgi:hypothetical protein